MSKKNEKPYIFQKWFAKRYIVYKDIICNDKGFIRFPKSPFSVLAPQKTTNNLSAPDVRPFKTVNWDVSNGYNEMPFEVKIIELSGVNTITLSSLNTSSIPITTYIPETVVQISAIPISSYEVSGTTISAFNVNTLVTSTLIPVTSLSSFPVIDYYLSSIPYFYTSSIYIQDDTQGYWCTGGNIFYNIPSNNIFNTLKKINVLPNFTVSGFSEPFDLLIEANTYKKYSKNLKTGHYFRSKIPAFTSFKTKISNYVKIKDINFGSLEYPNISVMNLNITNKYLSSIFISSISFNENSNLFSYNLNLPIEINSNSSLNIPVTSFFWSTNINFSKLVNSNITTNIIIDNKPKFFISNLKCNYKGYLHRNPALINKPFNSINEAEKAVDFRRRLRATGRI